jgi:tripartite-type tricarboxylate transporter receptor subunit TctC
MGEMVMRYLGRAVVLLSLLSGLIAADAGAQSVYPSRPIRLVNPYAPGGLTDVMARIIGDHLGKQLGQPVVVEPKAGGGTSIAATAVAQADPDGYTLLLGTTSLAINPALQPELTPKDPTAELAPIGLAYDAPFVLLVGKSVPVSSLAEFIDHAKKHPGELNIASSGVGAVNHLLIEMFNKAAGVKLVHIPYRGATPALIDLRAGLIQGTFATPIDAMPVEDSAAGAIIATTSTERIALRPNVPAVAESVKGFKGVFWAGLFAPRNTPQPVLDRLTEALRAVTDDSELRSKAAERGVQFVTGGQDDLRKRLREETLVWGELIRDGNIKPTQ